MSAIAIANGALLQGEYRLIDRIGDPSSSVFRARRSSDARIVAIRFWRGPLAAREKMLTLARAASRIRHPTLALVEGTGQLEDGTCYIVFEHVEGVRLDAWADVVGIAPLPSVIDLVYRVCGGLNAAHRNGLSHAALYPRNFILRETHEPGVAPRLQVKLLDLGVPAFMHAWPPALHAAAFMAPEQLRGALPPADGKPSEASPAMNVYSCGALLYYLCTGGAPHPSKSLDDLLAAHAANRLVPASRINPQVIPALDSIMLCALDPDPRNRFASASELANALISIRFDRSLSGVRPRVTPPADTSREPLGYDDLMREPTSTHSTREQPSPLDKRLFEGFDERPTSQTAVMDLAEIRRLSSSSPTLPPPSSISSTVPPAASSPPATAPPAGLLSALPPLPSRLGPPPVRIGATRSSTPPATSPPTSLPPAPPMRTAELEPSPSRASSQGEPASDEAFPIDPVAMVLEPPSMSRRPKRSPPWIAIAASSACLVGVVAFIGSRSVESHVVASHPAIARIQPLQPTHHALEPKRAAIKPWSEPARAQPQPAPTLAPAVPLAVPLPTARNRASDSRNTGRSFARRKREASVPATKHEPSAALERDMGALLTRESSEKRAGIATPDATSPALVVRPQTARAPLGEAAVLQAEDMPDLELSAKPASDPTPEPARAAPPRPVLTPQKIAPLPVLREARFFDLGVTGSLRASQVRRGVDRIRDEQRACYRTATSTARAGEIGELKVEIEIDERGRARSAIVTGDAPAALKRCIQAAALHMVVAPPDTGLVVASWKASITP